MKKQINPTIKAYLIRGAFYLLLLLAVCAIPSALAQSRSRGTARGTVARPAVHPNLTSLSSTISTTHAVPANPDFAPAGVIQGQLSSVHTREAAALASGATDASGAAVVKNLGAPLFPEGGCGTPGPWSTATPGPSARYRAGGCSDGAFVYVYGGQTSTGGFLNDLWRWTPATQTWTQLANMPTAKGNIQGAYWNGKIYVPGGFAAGVHITENAIYDIATNTWSTGAPLPAPQTGQNVAFNNKVYNFGGNPGPQSTVTIYDIAANTWSPGAPMPVPITYGRATVASLGTSYAYYAGGIAGVTVNTLYRYDFAANTWATMAPLQTARTSEELMSSPLGDQLYAVMGGDATFFTGVPLPVSVEIYQIGANSWSYGNPVVTKAAAPSGGRAGVKLMVQGGVDNTTYYDTVQVSVVPCGTPVPTPTASPTPTAAATATPTGSPSCTPGPVILQGSIDGTEPTHNSVNGAASSCAVSPACPGELIGDFHYDAYQLNNPSSSPVCITLTLSDPNCIYSEVYLGSVDPNNSCTNYLADSNLGSSYSVTVPGNATIWVVVEEFFEGGGCPSYTVTVDGLGSCASPTPTVSPTATPTATFTPTATATATATTTATATVVPRSTPTPRPRPMPPPRP